MPHLRPSSPRPSARAALCAAVVLALVAGCGDDGPRFRALPRGDLPAAGKTYGGTLLDADGDGRLDLLASLHGNVAHLYLNRPGPLLREELLPRPLPPVADQHGAAACDVDGDGRVEVLVTMGAEHGRGEGRNALWRLAAPLRFETAPDPGGVLADPIGRGRGGLWADLDGDRRPELLLFNYASPARLLAPDGDGWRDATDRLPPPPPVMPMRPGGPLPPPEARRRCIALHSAVAADFNDDARTDLLVLGRSGECALWVNDGNRFWDLTARSGLKPTLYPEAAKHAACGDLDGDGDLDLVVLHRRTPSLVSRRRPVEVWLNAPEGGVPVFGEAPLSPDLVAATDPLAAMVADLDDDGVLDLYLVQSGDAAPEEAPNLLFRGQGDGRFVAATAAWGGAGPPGGHPDSAWPADLDGDGDLDLVTFNGEPNTDQQEGGILCYENRGGDGHRGLTVELVARTETPQGLGARLELHVGDRVLLRRVRSVANPISSAVLPVHFGVGRTEGPFALLVRWPSGALQRVLLPEPGVAYRVVEGEDAPQRRRPEES